MLFAVPCHECHECSTVEIPAQYSSLGAAFAAVQDGDTISIAAGSFQDLRIADKC